MKINKILPICFCALIISGCASKDYSPNDFKKYTAKQILAGGEQAIAKRDYKEAIRYFEAIDALYPFNPEAEQGQLDVIYAYYKAEDNASALAAANRYIHLYPEGAHTDYAYYMKGVVNFDKDRTMLKKIYPLKIEKLDVTNLQDAYINFSELLKRFPLSVYAKDTEKRMLYVRNLLAEHELDIAEFYYARKAYVASANRASYIVQHFEGTSQVKRALKIMIKSYRALNLDKQANDALRVFNLNFPKESI
ncbi:MAG: outer membrane protein assembly factor BamD [Gammaproteobacteria bacterium]|nr:outer membrane protein assembly factor BamD [Gammaproteobacteria bacterium]